MPVATLIIPTYKREAPLRETLYCVRLLNTPNVEVIVVDQTAEHEPATAQLLAELAHTGRIHWIDLKHPIWPGARNIGIRAAQAAIVIFVDDDVAFAPDFVRAHLDSFQDPGVIGSAGRVHVRARLPGEPLPPAEPTETGTEWFDQTTARPAVALARGCNMAFRRDAALQIGGFDEHFIGNGAGEEDDFYFGLRSLGGRVVFNPQAWLIHRLEVGGARALVQDARSKPEWFHNQMYFALKNTGPVDTVRILVHAYRDAIANPNMMRLGPLEVLRRHATMLRGFVQGVRTWQAQGRIQRKLSYRVK